MASPNSGVEEMQMRPRRRWLPVAGIVVVLLLLPIASLVFADRGTEARVARLVAASMARWQALPQQRPALRGDTQPGRAWERYDEAIRLAMAWPQPLDDAFEWLWAAPEAGPTPQVIPLPQPAHRAEWRRALDVLRAAVQLEDLRDDAGLQAAVARLPGIQGLRHAAFWEASLLWQDGEHRAALDLWTDLLAFGLDLSQAPRVLDQLLGTSVIQQMVEFAGPERLRAASAEDLEAMARTLALADARVPVVAAFELDLAWTAQHWLSSPSIELDQPRVGRLQAWRHGFDIRSLAFASFEELWQGQTTLPALVPATTWRDRRLALLGYEERMADSDNPFTRMQASRVSSIEESLRTSLAGLRLLRLDLAWRLGHELPELPDPLGDKPLQVEIDGASATFRAVGADVTARESVRR